MIKEFSVYASWLNPEEKIGRCVIENVRGNETIGFAYERKWLQNHSDLVIDPDIFSMEGLQFVTDGKPCFGFLSDTSPDRWGRKLLDRREEIDAKEDGRPKRKLMESSYILGVHDGGRIGGMRFFDEETGVYLSDRQTLAAPPMEKLRQLEHAAIKLEEDSEISRWVKNLIDPGSSLGGARPKANVVDENGGMWIAKFPSQKDDFDVGAWEMAAHNLAIQCGIVCPKARAMRFSDSGTTYLSKRFDRERDRRVHYASAMTMAGKTDMENAGYIDLISVIEDICQKPDDALYELWKRLVFNVCISNTDDHLRNHGFLLSSGGWNLSPCFDVNPSYDKDQMVLSIADETRRDLRNVMEMTDFFRLTKAEAKKSISEIQEIIRRNWELEADRLRINQKEKLRMKPAFEEAYRSL